MAAFAPSAMRAVAAASSSRAPVAMAGTGAFRQTAVARSAHKAPKFATHLRTFQPEMLKSWGPVLAVWGIAAGGAVVLFFSSVPRFKDDVLLKVPIISRYFQDETPDSDKPF